MAGSTSKLLGPAFRDEVDACRSIAVGSDDDKEGNCDACMFCCIL